MNLLEKLETFWKGWKTAWEILEQLCGPWITLPANALALYRVT